MNRLKLISIFSFVLAIIMACPEKAPACSLALHDWQLKLFLKIPVNAPLVPLSEMSSIQERFKKPATDRILWVTKPGILTPFLDSILPIFSSWTAVADWQIVPETKSVLKLAKDYASESVPPIIVGSDKNYLKIAVFLDANSNNNCCQIVVAQDSRIRCVFGDSVNPWAQEFNRQSWFSLIFYRFPVPGFILSFSMYPINGVRRSIFEDHPLVEELLMKKILMRRPDLVIDPYSFDFPDLPE